MKKYLTIIVLLASTSAFGDCADESAFDRIFWNECSKAAEDINHDV